eukprot:gene21105-32515_t
MAVAITVFGAAALAVLSPDGRCPDVWSVDGKAADSSLKALEGGSSFEPAGEHWLRDIPESMRGFRAGLLKNLPATKNDEVSFTCCAEATEGCSVYFTFPFCPPCTTRTTGGYAQLLPDDGWELATCAPRFFDAKANVHAPRTVMFGINIAPGEKYVLPPQTHNMDFGIAFFNEAPIPDNWCPDEGPTIQGSTHPSCL